MTGPWQGEIRVETQHGQAAILLDRLVTLIERAQARLNLQPVAVERTSTARTAPDAAPLSFRQEKSAMKEWYVSYVWSDTTPQGQAREKVVDDLCAAAESRGFRVLRDKAVLRTGDSIAAFMRRIGAGDRIFVFLSDKYLKSPYCMFELLEIWRTSRQDSAALLNRVRVYTLDDADIWKPLSRTRYAAYWKKEYDEMDSFVRENGGTAILGEHDYQAYKRMGDFYRDVGNILAALADIVQPRSFEALTQYGFDDDPDDKS